jgi:hypothetical protein
MNDVRELSAEDFARAMPRRQRERIMRGWIDPAKDIAALRRFAGLTQQEFAEALGISVHTLRTGSRVAETPKARRWLCCVSLRATRACCGRISRCRLEGEWAPIFFLELLGSTEPRCGGSGASGCGGGRRRGPN